MTDMENSQIHKSSYEKDESGSDVLLSATGGQIMMHWEKQYMEVLVDRLEISENRSDVLEIGFGLGYSATRIQQALPRSHTIIECDPVVLERLDAWASEKSNVKVIRGTWQDQLVTRKTLQSFDCIFFDDYPLPENALDENQDNCKVSRWETFIKLVLSNQILRPGGGRITGYLAQELDLWQPGCFYNVTPINVDVSADCRYVPRADSASNAATMYIPLLTLMEATVPVPCISYRNNSKSSNFKERLEKIQNQRVIINNDTIPELNIVEATDEESKNEKEAQLLNRKRRIKALRVLVTKKY